ncbi:MAG TPA: BMP family ABC transporter substrate-binding protein [Pseudomonadota bacterium]|nr:BMP family ABC transporter substrate-binding protein [Pseudomonadota bacterium]
MKDGVLRKLLWVTLCLVVANVLVAWPRSTKGKPETTGTKGERPLRVGLVFDVGGRGDKSFNDAAFLGVDRAVKELGIEAQFIEPGDGADRESGLRLLAAQGFDLIFGVGFVFSDDMLHIAQEYPKQHFACVDYAKFDKNGLVMPPKNMVALKFREEEGSFLVGAVAALVSSSGVLGFVGGMDIPLIHKFEAGFRQGVHAVCSSCKVLVGYAGTSADAFKNPAKGKEIALSQYQAGAEVIFHAAGSTGLGVFEAARERKRKAIGVDNDQWEDAPHVLVTSMVKRIDVSVFQVILDLQKKHFEPGVKVFGLREGGVDYVYDEPRRGMIPKDVRERVEALRRDIISGNLVVSDR